MYKVTIIPRGRALGVTMFLPEEDRYSYSKERLESQISSLFGGRIAEELIFGPESVTTGASNDIQRATELARNMVTRWGLSERLGPLTYSEEEGEVFLGHSVTQHKTVSDQTQDLIDDEVRNIIDRNYQRATGILTEHEQILHVMAAALIRYETIDVEQIKDIMEGREPRPPQDLVRSSPLPGAIPPWWRTRTMASSHRPVRDPSADPQAFTDAPPAAYFRSHRSTPRTDRGPISVSVRAPNRHRRSGLTQWRDPPVTGSRDRALRSRRRKRRRDHG